MSQTNTTNIMTATTHLITNPTTQSVTLFTGLDIAKASLQLHLVGKFHLLTNDPKGHQQLLKLLRPLPKAQVVCEATGGYEQAVLRVLQTAAIPVSLLEPGRVRHFAKAQGLRAKTDPIDAAVLSDYGTTFQPAPTPPATNNCWISKTSKATAPSITRIVFLKSNPASCWPGWKNKSASVMMP